METIINEFTALGFNWPLSSAPSVDEVEKKWKEVVRKNHPDLHPGDKKAEERCKNANMAHDKLKTQEDIDSLFQDLSYQRDYGSSPFRSGSYGGQRTAGYEQVHIDPEDFQDLMDALGAAHRRATARRADEARNQRTGFGANVFEEFMKAEAAKAAAAKEEGNATAKAAAQEKEKQHVREEIKDFFDYDKDEIKIENLMDGVAVWRIRDDSTYNSHLSDLKAYIKNRTNLAEAYIHVADENGLAAEKARLVDFIKKLQGHIEKAEKLNKTSAYEFVYPNETAQAMSYYVREFDMINVEKLSMVQVEYFTTHTDRAIRNTLYAYMDKVSVDLRPLIINQMVKENDPGCLITIATKMPDIAGDLSKVQIGLLILGKVDIRKALYGGIDKVKVSMRGPIIERMAKETNPDLIKVVAEKLPSIAADLSAEETQLLFTLSDESIKQALYACTNDMSKSARKSMGIKSDEGFLEGIGSKLGSMWKGLTGEEPTEGSLRSALGNMGNTGANPANGENKPLDRGESL